MKRAIFAVSMLLALSSMGFEAAAQSRFDDGRVSFEVPQGWKAGANNADGSLRLMMDNRNSPDTILFIFDKTLPSELNDLGRAIEPRALAVVHTLGKSVADIRVERACPGARQELFSRWQAVDCVTLLKDAEGYRAMAAYIGVPLKGTTCLIVEFSSNYQGDLDALQKAHDVIEKTIDFAVDRASADTAPSVQAAPAPPTGLDGQDSGWRTYDTADFSFRYPLGAKVQVNPEKHLALAQDANLRTYGVRFLPGVRNSATPFVQCASADKVLQQIYKEEFEPLATDTNHYPYTKVTHDDFKPGWMGGRSTWVTITHVEKWQPPVTQEAWLNAVPRAGGMYVVMYAHPGEPENVSEPWRQAFIGSIVFKSGPLDKNAYCNAFGR